MSPYVIDQKKRQEYFLFLIFFIVISFALGYFFGYQNGQKNTDVNSNELTQSPSLGVPEEPKKDLVDPVKSTEEGKAKSQKVDLDIKSTLTKKQQDRKKLNSNTNKTKASKKTLTKSETNKQKIKTVSQQKTKLKSKPVSKPAKVTTKLEETSKKQILVPKTVNVNSNVKAVVQSMSEKQKSQSAEAASAETALSPSNATVADDKIDSQNLDVQKDINLSAKQSNSILLKSYSVQVGMFASKPNAEKFVSDLKGNGFEVYLGEFKSSDGVEKYNVRLGPYAERVMARDNMSLYKQSYTTPAYIVINK